MWLESLQRGWSQGSGSCLEQDLLEALFPTWPSGSSQLSLSELQRGPSPLLAEPFVASCLSFEAHYLLLLPRLSHIGSSWGGHLEPRALYILGEPSTTELHSLSCFYF